MLAEFWGGKLMNSSIWAYISAFMLAFIAPVKAVLVCVFILIVLDTITGVWAAYLRKEPITSGRLKSCLSKVLVYNISLLIGHMLGTYLIPFIPVAKVIAALIGIIEGLSLFENMYYIYPNKVIKFIVEKLRREEQKLEAGQDINVNQRN